MSLSSPSNSKRKERGDDPIMDLFLDIKRHINADDPAVASKIEEFESLLAASAAAASSKKQCIPLEFSEDDGDDDDDDDTDQWSIRYRQLRAFRIIHGHCKVSRGSDCSDDKLVKWVTNQKQFYGNLKNNKSGQKLKPERVSMLEALGIEWGTKFPAPVSWEDRFEEYKAYKNKIHKDPHVDSTSPTPLGIWVWSQRNEIRRYVRGKDSLLTNEQIDLLNEMEFDWKGARLA